MFYSSSSTLKIQLPGTDVMKALDLEIHGGVATSASEDGTGLDGRQSVSAEAISSTTQLRCGAATTPRAPGEAITTMVIMMNREG